MQLANLVPCDLVTRYIAHAILRLILIIRTISSCRFRFALGVRVHVHQAVRNGKSILRKFIGICLKSKELRWFVLLLHMNFAAAPHRNYPERARSLSRCL